MWPLRVADDAAGEAVSTHATFKHGIIRTTTLPTEAVRTVRNALTEVEWRPSTVGQKHDVFQIREMVDVNQRHALSAGFDRAATVSAYLVKALEPRVAALIERFWGLRLHVIAGPQFTKYTKGHFISPHTDSGSAYPHRMFSVVTYLSEDYEGGEIYFRREGLSFHPQMGETLIFPSTFVHGVSPVTAGLKEIFLFFLERESGSKGTRPPPTLQNRQRSAGITVTVEP